jgi:hypothetical protein
MKKLAAIFDWLLSGKLAREAVAQADRRRDLRSFGIRALPREDLLYVKAIDNARVVKVADRRDWVASVGMACSVLVASGFLIAMLLPGGYGLLYTRRINKLKEQRDDLVNQVKVLRAQESELLQAPHLKAWENGQYVDPPAEAVLHLLPADTAVASMAASGARR